MPPFPDFSLHPLSHSVFYTLCLSVSLVPQFTPSPLQLPGFITQFQRRFPQSCQQKPKFVLRIRCASLRVLIGLAHRGTRPCLRDGVILSPQTLYYICRFYCSLCCQRMPSCTYPPPQVFRFLPENFATFPGCNACL